MAQSYYSKHKLALGKGDHSAYGGMVLVHELLERTGIMSASDSIFGKPESGRGRSNASYVGTFAQLFLSGGDCLSDVSELEGDCLAQGFPSRQSLSSFLERKSEAEEYPKVEALFGVSVSRCLRGVPRDEGRVLDIDEQRVACEKECSEKDHKGEQSLMHTLVFDSGTGTVLASRLDPGNCTPGTGRSDVLEAAAGRLGGRKVRMVRADAAYCNAETIGWRQERGAAAWPRPGSGTRTFRSSRPTITGARGCRRGRRARWAGASSPFPWSTARRSDRVSRARCSTATARSRRAWTASAHTTCASCTTAAATTARTGSRNAARTSQASGRSLRSSVPTGSWRT